MTTPPDPPGDPPPPAPAPQRPLRTWWHPLLAAVLRQQFGPCYEVLDEYPLGEMPLRLDFLVLRQVGAGALPEAARRALAGLVERLNEVTLLDLKSPSDRLVDGDFQRFLSQALQYRVRTDVTLDPGLLTLVVVAPRLTDGYRLDLTRGLVTVTAGEEAGVWRLTGGLLGAHTGWLLETDVLAGVGHPVLTVVSRPFLERGRETYAALTAAGYNALVVYAAQQVRQFHEQGGGFAMQYFGADTELGQVIRQLLAECTPEERLAGLAPEQILAVVSPEQRLAGLAPEERLAGLAPEQRLAGLAPAQRLAGLAPEERLAGLSVEEREHLRQLLDQPPATGSAETSD